MAENASKVKLVAAGVAGMFATWGTHDFLQETVFRQPGFKFGLAMAFFLQGVSVLIAGLTRLRSAAAAPQQGAKAGDEEAPRAEEPAQPRRGSPSPPPASTPSQTTMVLHYVLLAGAIAAANGLSSSALNHVNMPAKVLFKSSKLIPVMIIGTLLRNETYGCFDYVMAVLISCGLAVFSSADLSSRAHFDVVGLVMLAGAITADAVAPNMQQRLLRKLKQEKEDVIFHTNWMSAVLTVVAMLFTGEAFTSVPYLLNEPKALMLLLAQSVAGYAGIMTFLWCIHTFGSRVTVIIASTRKMLTICISYIVYRKPFMTTHLVGIILVLGAVTLSGYRRGGKQKPAPKPQAPTTNRSRSTSRN